MNKVKYNLKSPKEQTSLIILNFRFDGKKLVRSTGIKILVKDWNHDKQRIRTVKGKPEYYSYNNHLDKIERAVIDAMNDFNKKSIQPTVLKLKTRVKELLDGKVESTQRFNSLYHYSKDYIEQKQAKGIIKKGTIDGYLQYLKVLGSFKNGKIVSFEDLTTDLLVELTSHMVHKYNYGSSMINKIQRKLRAVVNEANTKGYEINKGFYSKSWYVSESNLNDAGLAYTEEEIQRIAEVWLPPRLEKIRDRFLIGISVGQRYSDFSSLSIDDIVVKDSKEYFNIVQQKTKKLVTIPVSKNIRAILDKYDGYPPKISSQKFNQYLKEIGELVKLTDEIIVRKENPLKGVVSSIKKKKYELMSSHDCRRTYCTIAHNKGMPVGAIMKVSGHTSLATFSAYLKIDLLAENLNYEVY